tara:strand:+ start:308 stop:484 length:177 start_codon:yes stop_codon:yes gene_type:complete
MINTLVKIYNKWGENNANLLPLLSADEMLWNPSITTEQRKWLSRFIVIWQKAEQRKSL